MLSRNSVLKQKSATLFKNKWDLLNILWYLQQDAKIREMKTQEEQYIFDFIFTPNARSSIIDRVALGHVRASITLCAFESPAKYIKILFNSDTFSE